MFLRSAIAIILVVISTVFFLLLIAAAFYILYSVNACITTQRAESVSMSGLAFQISETDCSTLGEDASISIYGLNGKGGSRTLLFKYGPGPDVLPTVEVRGQDSILISIPVVSVVVFQERQWMNRRIDYDIGHIEYPSPDAGKIP